MAYNNEQFAICKHKYTAKNEKSYYKGILDTGYQKYSVTCFPSADGETMKVSLFKWSKPAPMRARRTPMKRKVRYNSYRSY